MKPRAEIAEQIQLRALRLNDFGRVVQWSRDVEFCLANGWQPSIEEEELYQWWANCVNGKTENFLRVGIEQEGLLIGYVDLADIRYGTASNSMAWDRKKEQNRKVMDIQILTFRFRTASIHLTMGLWVCKSLLHTLILKTPPLLH